MSQGNMSYCKYCGDALLPGFTDYCSEECEHTQEQRDQLQARFERWHAAQEKEMEEEANEKV